VNLLKNTGFYQSPFFRNEFVSQKMILINIRNCQNKIRLTKKHLALIKKLVLCVLAEEKINRSGEVTISFVTDKVIKKINKEYHSCNCATDCITFEYANTNSKNLLIADIIVSVETAISNAISYKTKPVFETLLYVTHGVLHLAGYEDKNERSREFMNNKAIKILSKYDL